MGFRVESSEAMKGAMILELGWVTSGVAKPPVGVFEAQKQAIYTEATRFP